MSLEVSAPEKQTMNTGPLVSTPLPPSGAPASFSGEEQKLLRDEDYRAARLVVGIMASVFTVGLALYVFIACLVAMGGH